MNREGKFWGRIVEGLWRADRMLNRIENGVLDGMPDSYLVIRSVMGWMELKCPIEPKRATTALFSGAHQLSQMQRNWLLSHRQAGGRGWIAIETENWVLLLGARHSDLINTSTLEQLIRLADFSAQRPMKEADWLRFESTFCNNKALP